MTLHKQTHIQNKKTQNKFNFENDQTGYMDILK